MADRIKNYQQEADQITTLKEIRTDLGVTSSSYTPDATVVTKDRVVTFAQAEEELVVLSDIEKGVKQQVTEVDIAQKDIANIKALLQGHLYDYQTDSTSAYTKSVPSGAMPYAGLEQIGGKTVVLNQLGSPYSVGDWRRNRCTVTADSDSAFTATCTSNAYAYFTTYQFETLPSSHVYLYSCEFKFNTTNQPTTFRMHDSFGLAMDVSSVAQNTFTQFKKIITAGSEKSYNIDFELVYASASDVTIGDTFSVKNYMLIDLTLLYGAGNEPTTVAEFESMFPASYYPYNAGTLLSAGVTEVVSKDSNNATLQTIPIPTAIRNLEGYGWSAGSVYNYIDFERKVFVQNVGKVTVTSADVPAADSANIGSGTWTGGKYNGRTYTYIRNFKYSLGGTFSTYKSGGFSAVTPFASSIDINNTDFISIQYRTYFIDISDRDTLLAKIGDGVDMYYELATPIETDISAYLTDDNLINVEAGGTLTFPNSNGDDYRIPVPSAETYMIDLQSAIGG